MKHSRAVRILAECARYRIQKEFAIEANLFEKGICTNARAEYCYKRRNEILEAVKVVSGQEVMK